MSAISTTIAEELGKTGLSVYPDFLSNHSVSDVRDDLELIQNSHGFHRAGTGQNEGEEIRNKVRRDDVHWLNRNDSNRAQDILWVKIDSLKQAFNRTLYQGLSSFEGHYASYPSGGFYKRHRDSFKSDDSRQISMVLYLNKDWKSQDAGQLRVYQDNTHTDINPVGGTLVCFMSRESEHEVLTSNAPRQSFTGWFKREQKN
ncbi:MAG: 2OG-Fe(II) oxygenase [Xanthomonadaceae bacterium]|nr:2OG-Fe(II) oxygenase [Xanthomonadaceae bacterium]